ncbi:MAG TPA: hypothetical protein VFZ77_25115 [Acidimicrobiales bacterium]
MLLVLGLGWSRRWLNEDAYINLRVVDQIFAGHGPTFNAGERVEVGTSPAWILVLCLARATLGHLLRMEWVAVVTSLAAAVGGFAVAARAARVLHGGRELVLPLGLLLVAAVPVVWDFATSGLEMGAVWLWTAACWLLVVHAARDPEGQAGWRRTGALAVLGFGPLVRPDLAVMSICLLAAWWVITRPDRRRLLVDVAAAGALPVAYQIFRMGYYASLVPNTALAKDASGLHLRQGLTYLGDLVGTYWLWLPLAVIAAVVARTLAGGDRNLRAAVAGMIAAGLVHAAYIVVAGGDYMHGRLLLPALFAVALPASVELRRGDLRGVALAAGGLAWAAVCMVGLRFEERVTAAFLPDIIDWRARTLPEDMVIVTERGSEGYLSAGELAALADDGRSGYVRVLGDEVLPADTGGRIVTVLGSIGVPAYHAGIDVWVIDLGGLGEPLAARSPAIPGRPAGHRKQVDPAWHEARWGVEQPPDAGSRTGPQEPPDPDAFRAAEAALACGPVHDLLDAVTEPVTPGRFLGNVWRSARFTFMEVPSDPREAPAC